MKPIAQARSHVEIPAGSKKLGGELAIPEHASGVVLFAHGSGSSRFSPRNQFVAEELARAGFATLLFDLLTPEEEVADRFSGQYRFDIELLAGRLAAATVWLEGSRRVAGLKTGYFGASTGGAAAIVAAAALGQAVHAVVSRGGRPDLAGEALLHVTAPTMLIVGERDPEVLRLNRFALATLRCPAELAVVPGATHLFEEPGALKRVSALAADWFQEHLAGGHPILGADEALDVSIRGE
jgi:dienelactone hydrolase